MRRRIDSDVGRNAPDVSGESDGDILFVELDESERTRNLRVRGELDLSTRHVIGQVGDQLANESADRTTNSSHDSTVVVDAAELTFVDAAGVSSLVGLRAQLDRAGLRLRTVNARSCLRRISAICGLDERLGLAPTEDPSRRV